MQTDKIVFYQQSPFFLPSSIVLKLTKTKETIMKNKIRIKYISFILAAVMFFALSPYSYSINATENKEQIIYTDSFENDSSEEYITSGAQLTISEGRLSVSGDGVVGLNDKLWYNATYEVEINLTGKKEWAGIQFNKSTPTAQRDEPGYMLYVRANGSVELYTGKNGVIASKRVDLGDTKSVKLKIVTTEDLITVYVNDSDTPLFDAKTSEESYGYFSFVNYMEGSVSYDNLKITCSPSDGKVKKVFIELPDNTVALGIGETAKLDLNVIPFDADHDEFTWKITDVYGNPSTLATINENGYITAGKSTGVVRVTVVSDVDPAVNDCIEFAIVEEAQRKSTSATTANKHYFNDFSAADTEISAYRAKMNVSNGVLNLLAQGITMTNLNGHTWGDASYEFDMDVGSVNEWAGVMICKSNESDIWDDSGYMLLVKPDGYFQFGVCGGFTPLAEGKINGFNDGTNHYCIVKNGESIRLYVNGADEPVADIKNNKFSEGYVSFVASTSWDAEKTAVYDNLSVTPENTAEIPDAKIDELYIVGEYGCKTVKIGSTLNIKAISSPFVDLTGLLTFTVENINGAEASVNKNGVLDAGKKTGTVKIIATTADGVSASVAVDIVKSVEIEGINVTANKNARVMAVGKKTPMQCNVFPANADNGNIKWNVYNTDGSETDLAAISNDGVLEALKCGTVRIRASLESSPDVYSEWIMTISEATNNGKLVVPSMKYSFFAHYVADLTTDINGAVITDPNELANAFDVEAYADKMAAMGCEYVVFTAWHYRMVCLFDSEAMTKWGMDNHRVDRDLLGEMIDAVNARGINVVLYTHAFDGYDFKTVEEGLKVGWGSALKPQLSPYYNKDFDHEKWNNFINDVYAEVMEKYGDRICGIWVDEGNMYEGMSKAVDFDRLIKTITSYNENLATFQNDHGFLYGFEYRIEEYWKHNEFADYSGDLMKTFKNKIPNPIISNNWWTSVSINSANTVPYEGKVLFRYQVLQSGASSGGGIQWAAGPYPGEGCYYEPGVCEAMEVMNAYLNPIAWTVKGTLPSTSFTTTESRNITNIGWGVATQSTDGQREYIHVLNSSDKSIDGLTLKLKAPADGKIFSEAYLAINNKKVDLRQDEGGVYLTLPEGETWSDIDTVIELKVKSADIPPAEDDESETESGSVTDTVEDVAPEVNQNPSDDPNDAPPSSFSWVTVFVVILAVALISAIAIIIKKRSNK